MSDEPISPASNDSDINKELAAEQSSGDATPKKSVRVSGRKSASKKSTARKSAQKESSDDSQDLPLNEGGNDESAKKKGPKTVVRETRTKLVDPDKKDDAAPADEAQVDSGQNGDDSNAPKKQGRQRGQGRQQNASRKRGGERNERQERIPVNEKKLREKAWKIFLAEVSEEGLALVSKSDAHRLAQRSFDVARAFLEEIERMKK